MTQLDQICKHILQEQIGLLIKCFLYFKRLKYYKAPLVPTIQERDPNEARV